MRFSLTRLVLVRHGETDWNRERRLQGLTDLALNETGRLQARALADRFRGSTADAVYTSPLVRASETAEAIASALGLDARPEALLRERDVGAWGGLTVAEVQARHGETWAREIAGEDLALGGGETRAEVQHRMAEALSAIDARHAGGTVVLVSHGMALKTLVCRLIGLHLAHAERIATPGNAAVTEFEGRRGVPRLVVLGDVTHLEALQSLSTNATR